jgi:hypothetical protein
MSTENITHRTRDGRQIALPDLTDGHLLSILPKLRYSTRRSIYEAEARRRGLLREDGTPKDSPRFELGRLVYTPGAREALAEAGQDPWHFLVRHQAGDWGDCCAEDAAENTFSVDKDLRVFSVYHTAKGEKIWVITEADRSATTILLPSEY